MPGAKDKSITTHISQIQKLQEEVSKWDGSVLKVKSGTAVEELFMHLTGVGHLEVLKLPSLNKWNPESAQAKLHEALRTLNNQLAQNHASFQKSILLKNTLPEQQEGVKQYATAAVGAFDKIVKDWKMKSPPTSVVTARKTVKQIRDTTWNKV